jgi:hypothetical protein
MTVYVVFGACGELSDYREWEVAAYTDEARALDHLSRCNEYLKKFLVEYEDHWDSSLYQNPHDPKGEYSSYKFHYFIWALEVEE